MRRTRLLTFNALLALTVLAGGNPPAWWQEGDPPVIDPAAVPNNHGPANIGQAKQMARSALVVLSSVLPQVAADIEAALVGSGKPIPNWNPPADQSARDKNHAPLLTGQLKAIAHPFYVHLHAAAPTWLAEQRAANGTESGGIFPWTNDSSDDNHHGMANIGQLKAVFALHFTRDTDGDTLLDISEHILGTNPDLSQTFTGIPDAWLASYYTTVIGFNSQQDDDEGLTNFEEYLHGTNPLNSDTDGDGVSDYAEVNQGSNPNNASNGGGPPPDPVIDVSFLVGGDYASWRMEILPKGPRDDRAALKLASPNPGETETKTLKLWKNNRYEITLHRTGGEENWYCWEAMVEDGPDAITFDDGTGWISDGERNEEGLFFTVAGHWLVDNRQGLLTNHIHSYSMDVASPLKAELVPVAIEDNIEATGVDIVSNSAVEDDVGYQDKLWIMAPSGNDPDNNPCSDAMKFRIPINPSSDLDISYPQGQQAPATTTSRTVTLGAAAAACAWHGESATTTETPVPVWEIGASGETKTEVDLPVAVKTMKRRTVRVVVWPVNLETMPGIFPDAVSRNQFEAGLEAELDGIFASQINAWFDVSVGLNKTFDYLDGTSGGTTPAPYTLGHGTKQNAMIDTYRDGGFDINVFLIDNLLLTNDPADPWAGMILGTSYPVNFPGSAGRENSVVANKSVYYTNSTQQKHTIAHEIGHLLLGPGHPDKYEEGDPESGGPAPLPSLPGEHPKRLMHSNSAVGKLLVKGEWDRAEVWLSGRPNGDN